MVHDFAGAVFAIHFVQNACLISTEKAASTLCDPRAAVARFTTISCLHLNESEGVIPGDIRQLRVELLLTGAPTLAKTG